MNKKILLAKASKLAVGLAIAGLLPLAASAQMITSISPTSSPAGSGPITLTVNGSGYVSGSTVTFNGINKATTYVSSTQLTAVIPAADLTSQVTAQAVKVRNPDGSLSNTILFGVTSTDTTPGLPDTGFGPEDDKEGMSASAILLAIIAAGALG